jgi:hypothetical protein
MRMARADTVVRPGQVVGAVCRAFGMGMASFMGVNADDRPDRAALGYPRVAAGGDRDRVR